MAMVASMDLLTYLMIQSITITQRLIEMCMIKVRMNNMLQEIFILEKKFQMIILIMLITLGLKKNVKNMALEIVKIGLLILKNKIMTKLNNEILYNLTS